MSTTTPAAEDPARGVRTASVFVRSDPDQLAELAARVDSGRLRLNVADRRPLADLPAVHAESAAGRLRGMTVLIPG